jgi:hypothetical protein
MMADDIKKRLKKISRLEAFSIALDDITDTSDTAQVAIFIRGVDEDFNITEELLALQSLKVTTTGEDIFETVNTVFERFGLKWSSLSGICTDGAPAMVGARKGLIGIVHERAIELQIHPEILTHFKFNNLATSRNHFPLMSRSLYSTTLHVSAYMQAIIRCCKNKITSDGLVTVFPLWIH